MEQLQLQHCAVLDNQKTDDARRDDEMTKLKVGATDAVNSHADERCW